MIIYDYYAPHFVSGTKGNYSKVSIEVADDNGIILGMFAILLNNDTLKTQMQVYNYKEKCRDISRFAGKIRMFTTGKNLMNIWDKLDEKDKQRLHICQLQLNQALNRFYYLMKYSERPISEDEFNFINEKLHEINHSFFSLLKGQIFSNKEEEFEVQWEDEKINPNRSMIKMIKIKNANGLTEFINGNFYPIIRLENFDNKKYFTIKNDKGEERTLSQDRVEEVDVFENYPK